MASLMEGESTQTNYCVTKGCSKRVCSMDKAWYSTSPDKPTRAFSNKTFFIMVCTNMPMVTFMKENSKTTKNQEKVNTHLQMVISTKVLLRRASAVVMAWWLLPIGTHMKGSGRQGWNMVKEGILGRIRLFMKAVSGWIRDKERGRFSIPMPVGTRGTGEMISDKVRECFLRTILQLGFSIDIFLILTFV